MKQLTIGQKIYLGFGIILFLTLTLGLGSYFIANKLEARIADNNQLEEYISLGSQLQEEANRWLIRRESLSRQAAGKEEEEAKDPLAAYARLHGQLQQRGQQLHGQQLAPQQHEALSRLQPLFADFHSTFQKFQGQFGHSVQLMDKLRKQSTAILASALSLDKAVKRQSKKLKRQLASLQKQMGPAADNKALLEKSLAISAKLEEQSKRRGYTAILINKPLGFQEMAKDFVIYQEPSSGRGLISDIEKLLGQEKGTRMDQTLPAMSLLFSKGREAKLFAAISSGAENYLQLFKEYYQLNQSMEQTLARL